MNCKNKKRFNKKAFTLVELLIVVGIIGILFIVLVSKVDFATDKAKATGVQTDFRSFQMAFDTVAKENAGFNTFGWDTGDANQDGIRNSYDEGDTNQDGIQNGTEVFTGHKVYAETFTKVYSLKKNGTGSYDRDALNRLETAINANLDPKLHITIKDDGEIVMANGAKDPWNKEYHGWYITNAEVDKKDRGAIIIYSDGANNEFGSEHAIANGVVSISIPGSNKYGKDDYSIVSCYTYLNGYGEVKNMTSGFSNNQTFLGNNNMSVENNNAPGIDKPNTDNPENLLKLDPGIYDADGNLLVDWETLVKSVDDGGYGLNPSKNYTYSETSSDPNHFNAVASSINNIDRIVIPGDVILGEYSFSNTSLKSIIVQDGLVETPSGVFSQNRSLIEIVLPNSITKLGYRTIGYCTSLTYFDFPDNLIEVGEQVCCGCESLKEVSWPTNVQTINRYAFYKSGLVTVELPDTVQLLGEYAFACSYTLRDIKLSNSLTTIQAKAFSNCDELETINLPSSLHTLESNALWGSGIIYITIPSTVTTIDSYAFQQCYRLAEICNLSTIPNDQLGSQFHLSIINDLSDSKIVKQGDFVFYDNMDGTVYLVGYTGTDSNIVLPNYKNQEYVVNDNAFTGDRKTLHITIPEYVVDLNDGLNCAYSLQTITVLSDSMLPAYFSKYSKLTTLKEIYVHADLVEVYKNDQYWSVYSNLIKPIQ